MNKTVWLYCRTAVDDQTALYNQIKQLSDFARQKGFDIVGITSETGNGLSRKRHGLKELMYVAKFKKADMILTRDESRISRDSIYYIKFIRDIKKHIEFKTMRAFDIESDELYDMVIKILGNKKEQIA